MFGQLVDLLKGYNDPRDWIRNIRWRLASTVSDIDLVFVVGAPRSGTTLLQRMLLVHSRFYGIPGETGIFSKANLFDLGRRHFGLPDEQVKRLFVDSADVVDFFQRAISLLDGAASGARFVEKTPQHVLQLPFILRHFPRAHVVNLVRDGRDCFCSARQHPRIPQKSSVQRFARYWRSCIRMALRHETHPRVLTVKYEELVRSPLASLQRVMAFLGEPMEAAQMSPDALGSDQRSGTQEFARLREPIDPRTVGRWVEELSPVQNREFIAVAGPELAHYGYMDEPRESGPALD
jgi:hypothetical protein